MNCIFMIATYYVFKTLRNMSHHNCQAIQAGIQQIGGKNHFPMVDATTNNLFFMAAINLPKHNHRITFTWLHIASEVRVAKIACF